MTRLIIVGARGKMGQTLRVCAHADKDFEIVGEIDVGDDLANVIARGDVVVEFSSHNGTPAVAHLAAQHKKALVLGTTGHTDAEKSQITSFQSQIPIVWAPNFSVGVNVLFHLAAQAARLLGAGFDVEVVEMHHRQKTDAPSGTARRLAEIIATERKLAYETAARHGRVGNLGPRADAEIGIHSIRGGDVVGEHTAIFAALGERLELTHKAGNRETFARGALRAAKWVVGKKAGLYDMQDVLGLR